MAKKYDPAYKLEVYKTVDSGMVTVLEVSFLKQLCDTVSNLMFSLSKSREPG